MIELSKIKEVYLFTGTTDFRLGMSALALKVKMQFHCIDLNNTLFIFCSKKKDAIKVLEFEEGSTWMYFKKLTYGQFIYPDKGTTSAISISNLKTLLNGLDFIYKIEGKNKQKYDEY